MRAVFRYIIFIWIILSTAALHAQVADTTKTGNDSILVSAEKSALESQVKYKSRDSIQFDVKQQVVEMYGEAVVDYGEIHLEAAYIRIDFSKFLITAYGMMDSTGKIVGIPLFQEKDQKFTSDTIKYNYQSKKGIIQNIFSEQGGGFLHGERVKKMPDNTILVRDGSFTTCDLRDPHFQISFNKAKVIPDDKIVTGPVWLEIEDIPTPLALPFGFFPNKKGRASGILIPTYGESARRGFFLENGGYYFGISDYVDLALRGDIYSRGSWALKAQSNYKKRYKYDGYLDVSFARNIFGERNTPDYQRMSDFFIKWTHNQDPKARPRSRFSANVQAGTSNYNNLNPSSTQDYLTANYSSSISYSTSIGNLFNFTANLNQTQNRQTHAFNMTLPELSLSSNRIYPLRRAGKPRKVLKALDNITISYAMNARNSLNTIDSLLFDDMSWQNFNNGIKHSIPVSMPVKLLKVVTMNNSFTYNERWYFSTIEKNWSTVDSALVTDTLQGFSAARDFAVNSSFSTKLYTFLSFKKGPVSAFRHVLTPAITLTYRPDFSEQKYGYYKQYLTPGSLTPVSYSIYEQGIFGGPSAGKQSMATFSLGNNLEMKVRSAKDTVSGFKKVTLIDNVTLSASYNAAADSLRWTTMYLSGRTRLFKNMDIRYAAIFDPYATDTAGRRINQFEWNENHRIFRQDRGEWGASLNYMLNNKTFKAKGNTTSAVDSTGNGQFKIAWNLSFSYTLQYTRDHSLNATDPSKVIQTLSFNGDIRLTPSWKFSMTSGYDFVNHDFSFTSINIHRDLHCWEILFSWIPYGPRKQYNMTIRVKSSILQDLKLEKKTDWRDQY